MKKESQQGRDALFAAVAGGGTVTMANRPRNPWKRRLKYLLAKILRCAGIFRLERLFSNRCRVLILAFHRVVEEDEVVPCLDPRMFVTSRVFREILVFLRGHYDVVPLGEVLARDRLRKRSARPACALTFDDGYADNYTNAFPILTEMGTPATVFLTAGLIGTKRLLWYDAITVAFESASRNEQTRRKLIESLKAAGLSAASASSSEEKADRFSAESMIRQLKTWPHAKIERLVSQLASDVPRDESDAERFRLLTWEQVRKMSAKGISFGSHTLSHCILPVENDETVQTELAESKSLIQSRLGTRVEAIAYPNGDCNDGTIRAAHGGGFRIGLTLKKEHASPSSDAMRLGRFLMNQDDIATADGCFSKALFEYETSFFVLRVKRFFQRLLSPRA